MTLETLGLTGVKQTILGRGPDFKEPAGNCMQAVLATVLGRSLETVPHFLEQWSDIEWWSQCNAWLIEHHAVALIHLNAGDWPVPPVLHLMVGKTVRGSDHVVVGFGGVCIFDPHPSDDGLVTIEAHELFVAQTPGTC